MEYNENSATTSNNNNRFVQVIGETVLWILLAPIAIVIYVFALWYIILETILQGLVFVALIIAMAIMTIIANIMYIFFLIKK